MNLNKTKNKLNINFEYNSTKVLRNYKKKYLIFNGLFFYATFHETFFSLDQVEYTEGYGDFKFWPLILIHQHL